MKRLRSVFLMSAGIGVLSLGVVVYLMFWGPDHIELSGRTLPELLKGEALPAIAVVLVTLIISGAVMVPFLRTIFPAEIKNAVSAQAKVLKVWDTGVSINDNPQVGMLLEVTPAMGAAFQAEAKTVVSRLNAALVQPGVTVEVKYDPLKPQRLRVETIHVGGETRPSAAARMQELEELRDKRLISEAEYQRKREEILKAL